jgi:hypothetical protein
MTYYKYDSLNRLIKSTNNYETRTYEYKDDLLMTLKYETSVEPNGPVVMSGNISYTYNDLKQIINAKEHINGKEFTTYYYYDNGLLTATIKVNIKVSATHLMYDVVCKTYYTYDEYNHLINKYIIGANAQNIDYKYEDDLLVLETITYAPVIPNDSNSIQKMIAYEYHNKKLLKTIMSMVYKK